MSEALCTVVIIKDGSVKACGHNLHGELGLGDTTNRTVPTVVSGLSGVKTLFDQLNS